MTDKAYVHVSRVGTYHPPEDACPAWTVNNTRGYVDGGPSCDECGACECACPYCGSTDRARVHGQTEEHSNLSAYCCEEQARVWDGAQTDCIGLSFAFVCLDGGESLCERCAERAGIEIVPCDCEGA